jgi:hypothetical protein
MKKISYILGYIYKQFYHCCSLILSIHMYSYIHIYVFIHICRGISVSIYIDILILFCLFPDDEVGTLKPFNTGSSGPPYFSRRASISHGRAFNPIQKSSLYGREGSFSPDLSRDSGIYMCICFWRCILIHTHMLYGYVYIYIYICKYMYVFFYISLQLYGEYRKFSRSFPELPPKPASIPTPLNTIPLTP